MNRTLLVYDHVYEFSTEKKKWSLVKKLDFGIYSHSTVCWKGFLIINGGLKDFSKCQVNRDLILIQPEAFGSSLRQVPNLPNHYFGRFAHTSHITGKSLSEALIHSFLHLLTQNMTTDCSLNYKFSA